MSTRSKRFTEAQKKVDATKKYTVVEAVALARETSTVKFDAGVEIHLRLGIDSKKADQIVRGSVSLPHGTGKKKKVAVFAEGKDAEAAKKAGADMVGGLELIKEIKLKNAADFEVAIAHPSMMRHLGQIAKVLGPKGLMPNPKNETVTPDVAKAVKDVQGGKVSFRNDDTGNIHQLVGRVSFETKQLEENLNTFLEAIQRAKPQGAKGAYILTATLTSSMGPAILLTV
ncbi:MAG: 50S ribosomal protein L1 [Patescibacteria group bacterium]|jgi:large subunit ribosomal protein L1